MKRVVKGGLLALVGLCFYRYVYIPVTVPEQVVDTTAWTEEDLAWRDDNVFWFIQVTDLHISKYVHLDIKSSLDEFFTTTLGTIKPKLVVASGDLTDAKDKGGVDSFQIADEWETYAELLARHGVQEKTIYLDIRGNHDTFNVPHLHHEDNLHRHYSAQGAENPSTYVYNFSFHNKTYSFFAVDATMKTGPKKVFNFLGLLTQADMDDLLEKKKRLAGNTQIFFGHYPSSCVVAPGQGFTQLFTGGLVYLSGHLHTLGGLAPQLYTMHRVGTPELELADWKENRMFRLLAIDNGILTFSDNKHEDWPVVQVTNPKSARFLAPQVEPVQKIRHSTHIRVIAFSPANISHVTVQLNGVGTHRPCHAHPNTPNLYLAAWDVDQLIQDAAETGHYDQHYLTVYVTDGAAREKVVRVDFQLEFDKLLVGAAATGDAYSLYARLILMCSVVGVLQFCWLAALVVSILPVYLARRNSSLLREVFHLRTCSKMMELAQFGPFYYLYIGTALLVGLGPWSVIEVLDGRMGVIFPWSTMVAGHFLPSFYPYVFSFVHLLFFQTSLFWSLLYKFKWRVEGGRSRLLLALSNIPVTLVLASQACLVLVLYFFPSKLGIFREISLLIAPMEAVTICLGFFANGFVSYYITEFRKK